MIRRGLVIALVLVLVAAAGEVVSSKPLVAAVLGWSVCAYLLWRAWPGLRSDLGRTARCLGRGRRIGIRRGLRWSRSDRGVL